MSRKGELVLGFCGNFNHWVASRFEEMPQEVEWEKRSQELLEGRNPDQWHPCPRPDVSDHIVLVSPGVLLYACRVWKQIQMQLALRVFVSLFPEASTFTSSLTLMHKDENS